MSLRDTMTDKKHGLEGYKQGLTKFSLCHGLGGEVGVVPVGWCVH